MGVIKMRECFRCEGILNYLKKTIDRRTLEGEQTSLVRVRGNLEEIYKASGCERRELICNPLKKLEQEDPKLL